MSGPHHAIRIIPSAYRSLAGLRGPIQDQLRGAIRQLADDPMPDDSVAMAGGAEGLRRLRVGHYRIVYRVLADPHSVLVIRIAQREIVYRGL